MKMVRFGIAIGLLAGLGACSNMMGRGGMMGGGGSSHPTAAAQPSVSPDMVRQVQSKLRDDGYYKQGAVDGVWGSGTEAAVRSFQRDHNLNANGQLDVPTLQALNIANGPTTSSTTSDSAPTQPMGTNPPPVDTTTPSPPR